MIKVSVSEAKTRLPELLRRMEAGERIVITRHGRPVGELVDPWTTRDRNNFSFAKRDAMLRADGYEPEAPSGIPEDFDDPIPEEWWFQEDDELLYT